MTAPPEMSITVTENGPYMVAGGVPLALQTIVSDEEDISVEWREGGSFDAEREYRLCRCGQSSTKPFCDDSHERVGFDGTETATREPYLAQAEEQDGPTLILTDAEQLCAFARFCDYGGRIWNLVERDDRESAALTVREATRCPSGRLVAWDRSTQEPHEESYPPSIGVVEDPTEKVSGPLWVRGGIQVIAADGHRYEVRSRITLCRCGRSSNKPFCDGTHAAIGFDDGLGAATGVDRE
ncbi:MAG TPA: CDGSH iron-sulfur domain-containing protein [Actinomycetota bacterium]|nr:CDGSH iron-sulfur domain-containing protein [Actinomycetota bacterium]